YSALPGQAWPMPKAIAPGIDPAPLEDLIFHGGRVVPQMEFQNVYVGSANDWPTNEPTRIDDAITRAMQERRLNNAMPRYFPGARVPGGPRPSILVGGPAPAQMDEPDVQAMVRSLFEQEKIDRHDLSTTIFNLVLPPGTELRLGDSSSLHGLGGYHGSLHL